MPWILVLNWIQLGSKTGYSKTGFIWKPDQKTYGLSMSFENRTFFTGFRMVKRPVLECHSKIRPLENWTKVEHSKTGHVRFTDPHFIRKKNWTWICPVTILCFRKNMLRFFCTKCNTVSIWITALWKMESFQKWNVGTLSRRGSSVCFFAAIYCSCLEWNACLPSRHWRESKRALVVLYVVS